MFEQPPSENASDVQISLADLSVQKWADEEKLPVINPTEYSFYVPEVGYYRVLNGSVIIVAPLSAAGSAEVRLFLLGTAWGALCYQRGLPVFHASAVLARNGVAAFCGEAGMGKSSMLAWLTNCGYPFVSDDLCRFDIPDHGAPVVHPSTPRLKLWRDALGAMGLKSDKLERDHFRFDKFHLQWTGQMSRQPFPLQGIYLLEWGEPGIMRLSGREAMSRFMTAATYRGELLEPMGQLGWYWDSCLKVLNRVPVWELKRPRDLSTMENTVKLLEDHWVDIGLEIANDDK